MFQKKDYSKAKEVELPSGFANPVWVVELLRELKAVGSSSEAKRLFESGAVLVDDQVIKEFKAEVLWSSGTVIKVGKHRIYKIK